MAKKPVVTKPLTGSKSTRAYQPVQGSLGVVPNWEAWKRTTLGEKPQRDSILRRIDECLLHYGKSTDGWDRLALLGELYFATDFFLKRAPRAGNAQFTQRVPAVEQLFRTVVDMLCKAFGCSANVLPQMLEECWGRVLTHHGWKVDTQAETPAFVLGAPSPVATYLTRVQVEKYRVRIANGVAEMRDSNAHLKWVPADSTGIGWEDARLVHPEMMEPGYAGFALSMGRVLFMAHHKGCFHKDNFFHSSYLAGDSVLCTGTILIQGGTVYGVKNDSGHYQPSIEHLVNVAETLQMFGVNLRGVKFTAVAYSWRDSNGVVGTHDVVTTGDELLALRGGGAGLRERINRNQANVNPRGGGNVGLGRIRALPSPPVTRRPPRPPRPVRPPGPPRP